MVDNSHTYSVGHFTYDTPDGSFSVVSDAARAIIGLNKGEPPTLDAFFARVHPEDAARVFEAIQFKDSSLVELECRTVPAEGDLPRVLRFRLSVERDSQGRELRVYGMVEDITNLQRPGEEEREQERRHREDQLRMLTVAVEHISNGVIITDARGKVVYVNPAFVSMLHTTEADLVGRHTKEIPWAALMGYDTAKILHGHIHRQETATYTTPLSGSSPRSYRYDLRPIFDQHNNLSLYVAVITDVTAEVSREEALRQMHRELDEKVKQRTERLIEAIHQKDALMKTASIDLKNPLTGISLAAQVLQHGIDRLDKATVLSRLVSIERSADRMLTVLEDMLQENALETRAFVSEMHPIDVRTEVLASVMRARQVSASKNIAVHFHADAAPVALGEEDLLNEILDHLLSNAVKYSHSGSVINVSLHDEHTHVAVSVADNGVGIPADEIHRLFEKRPQLSPKPTAGERSMGLGLWIASRLADSMNGSLAAESEPGRGSTFTLRLRRFGHENEHGT